MEEKKSHKRSVILVLILLLIVAIAFGVWYLFFRHTGFERYKFDTEAMEGRLQQMTDEEIQQELNRVVEDGMFNISIASSIVFESPESEGEARIENIAANHYHMQVDIFLDETNECVYSSDLIRPGYSIEKIKLEKKLEPGEYAAKAVFSAITQEDMKLFGQAGAEVKLYVLDENGEVPGR